MLFHKNSCSFVFQMIGILTLAISPLFMQNVSVQAQEIRTLKDYLDNCIPQDEAEALPEECDRLREAHQLRQQTTDDSVPRRSRRIRRDRQEEVAKSGGIGGYAGIILGVYFPDLDEERPVFQGDNVDTETGFGSSIFAGIQFNPYLGTDLELSALAGNINSDLDEDETYTLGGLFLNPRFTLPLTKNKKNNLALYLSPGIGVSQLSASVEDEIEVIDGNDSEDLDRTTIIEDDSRFTWQIKGGVSVPVSSKFSVIPQLRYTSQTGDNAVDYFGLEVGVKFDF